MSVAIAVMIVAGLGLVSLLALWTVRKFRYVIWSGYFRAIIICEDGDIIAKTMRLKTSDTEFKAVVKGKADTYHLISKEEEVGVEGKKSLTAVQRQILSGEDKESNSLHNMSNRRIYRQGRFRLPTAFYNAHQAEPIDMQNLRKFSGVSATRYNELAKNTVTSQLLNAFNENTMREAMIYMMAIVIILGGMLILGYFLNSRLNTIVELLQ